MFDQINFLVWFMLRTHAVSKSREKEEHQPQALLNAGSAVSTQRMQEHTVCMCFLYVRFCLLIVISFYPVWFLGMYFVHSVSHTTSLFTVMQMTPSYFALDVKALCHTRVFDL